MSTSYLGEIRMFGFAFPPRGMAVCDGRLMQVSQYSALFALLGTDFGGNGQITFGLPDLRGRVPINAGQGPTLSNYAFAQVGGAETVGLLTEQLPAHTHVFADAGSAVNAIATKATDQAPARGSQFARGIDGSTIGSEPWIYVPAGTAGTAVALGGLNVAGTNAPTGSNQRHPNIQPYLTVNFSINLQGIFPSRN